MPVDESFLKDLPKSPGVYLMLDRNDKVLYVGKAGNVRNRVRSYFVRHGDERPKIQFLMERVENIRTILTDTEKEALILENNLIKQHRPKYNVDLRDDKSFFSLRLNVSHPFPRLTLVRTQKIMNDGERYFGPYSSARDARVTLNFILKLFPLRQCTDRQIETTKRPCLNCQMKKCLCPCGGGVDKAEYDRMVEGVTMLLQGKSADLVKTLEHEMRNAARELRFEEAARIRDRISSIQRTLEVQNVSFFHLKDQDVIALVSREPDAFVVQALAFRQGNLLSEESFRFRNPALEPAEVLASALKQYYGGAAFIPKEVLISHEIENIGLIESWLSELRGNRVTVRVPARGTGARLLRLALKNAHNTLLREIKNHTMEDALAQLGDKLGLQSAPAMIEGYDISNVSGAQPVGVKVAFHNGSPVKSAYRTFTITGFPDQDDPGMIFQTISRRVRHSHEDPMPDLLLIDGGKSQLAAAVTALREHMGDSFPPVISIAKGRQEGEDDKIYVPNRKNPLKFANGDPALMLLMRVRDESHRFVHSFHQKSRKKAVIRSALEQVPGIGPRKRDALLTAFGSLAGILRTSDDDLLAVDAINSRDVANIRSHFADKPGEVEAERPRIGLEA
jgi:excinuclease ABC subunit C